MLWLIYRAVIEQARSISQVVVLVSKTILRWPILHSSIQYPAKHDPSPYKDKFITPKKRNIQNKISILFLKTMFNFIDFLFMFFLVQAKVSAHSLRLPHLVQCPTEKRIIRRDLLGGWRDGMRILKYNMLFSFNAPVSIMPHMNRLNDVVVGWVIKQRNCWVRACPFSFIARS